MALHKAEDKWMASSPHERITHARAEKWDRAKKMREAHIVVINETATIFWSINVTDFLFKINDAFPLP